MTFCKDSDTEGYARASSGRLYHRVTREPDLTIIGTWKALCGFEPKARWRWPYTTVPALERLCPKCAALEKRPESTPQAAQQPPAVVADDDTCPRCGSTETIDGQEYDFEPDGRAWTDEVCARCGLIGRSGAWFVEYGGLDRDQQYDPTNPEHQQWKTPEQ